MAQHTCIKCSRGYVDEEIDDYYCARCLIEKKRLATSLDAKFKGRITPKPMSELQKYDSLPNFKGFVRVKDLGV